jgi:hypothetical protein
MINPVRGNPLEIFDDAGYIGVCRQQEKTMHMIFDRIHNPDFTVLFG